jgi:hypothetical protein
MFSTSCSISLFPLSTEITVTVVGGIVVGIVLIAAVVTVSVVVVVVLTGGKFQY